MSFPEVLVDDSPHRLLEPPPSPAYSCATVRRAFVVWMYCGRQNQFKDVCDYYHYLEALEEKLPASARESSRHLEFDLFTKEPPTSPYLTENHPRLYPRSALDDYVNQLVAINHHSIRNLQHHSHTKNKNGVTTEQILETSQLIKKYCKRNLIPLYDFLSEFNDYTKVNNLQSTVKTVNTFIKHKMSFEQLKIGEKSESESEFVIDGRHRDLDDTCHHIQSNLKS